MKKTYLLPFAVAALFLIVAAIGKSTPPGVPLRFDHKLHVQEVGVECATCHAGAQQSSSGTDQLIPGMGVCAECHDVESEDGCKMCHPDPSNIAPLSHAGKGYEAFSHKLHTPKVSCEECHAVQSAKAEVGAKYPDMKACATCHADKGAAPACQQCHTTGALNSPATHKVNWQKEHGEESQFNLTECAMCHEAPGAKTSCTKCHEGAEFGMPHPRNFVHSTAFVRGGGFADCQSCHEAESFCAPCHAQNKVMPSNHSNPGWATLLTSASKGGMHAIKGETDLESCIICHANSAQQPTCFSAGCHQ